MPAFRHVPCIKVSAGAEVLGKLLVMATSLLLFHTTCKALSEMTERQPFPYHVFIAVLGADQAALVGISTVFPFPSSGNTTPHGSRLQIAASMSPCNQLQAVG